MLRENAAGDRYRSSSVVFYSYTVVICAVMPRTPVIDLQILKAALEGLEAQRLRIAEQIARVRELLGSRQHAAMTAAPESTVLATRATREPRSPRKRRLSVAGRKAIAEAARKRWAKQRKREAEEEKIQAETKARRVAAMAKARKALAASRKAAKKAVKKAPVQRASASAKTVPGA